MNCVVDTSNFQAMLKGLTAQTGNPGNFRQILDGQAAQLLSKCVSFTRKKKLSKLKAEAFNAASKYDSPEVKVNLGAGGKIAWMLSPSTYQERKHPGEKPPRLIGAGLSLHPMNVARRWSDARWSQFQAIKAMIQAQRDEKIKKAIAARGLIAQSWVQIAEALKIAGQVNAPGYVRSAKTFKGNPAPTMGAGTRTEKPNETYLDLINFSRIITSTPQGKTILQRAMNTRARAFASDVERQLSGKLVNWASRYKGVTTK